MPRRLLPAVVLALFVLPGAHATAEPLRGPGTEAARAGASAAVATLEAALTPAQTYCQNIAAAAADARFARQVKQIKDLEGELKARTAELEAKQAEYRAALAQHEQVMKRARDGLVDIYAHMRPEAAAAQLSALDDTTASAVLAQLTARQASAILNEIAPERAVRLVNAMTAVGSPDGKKS